MKVFTGLHEAVWKARVTAVGEKQVEVITEGSWKALHVDMSAVSLIDESRTAAPPVAGRSGATTATDGPKDFSFLMKDDAMKKESDY